VLQNLARTPSVGTLVVSVKKHPTAHSSTFGFLPIHKAQTKKPKELEFFPTQ